MPKDKGSKIDLEEGIEAKVAELRRSSESVAANFAKAKELAEERGGKVIVLEGTLEERMWRETLRD